MPPSTLTVFAKDLAPWAPDIDARRGDKPAIITGANFIDDVDGPRSAFSSGFVNFNFWDAATRGKVTELPLNSGGNLYGTQTGVWRINQLSGQAEPLLLVTVTNKFWPWTIAYVGGVYYLAQYDIGLWQYDPNLETLSHIVTPAADQIRFVAPSFGRLIYLTPDSVAISALDNGTDLIPSLTTAAGAQPLSLVGGVAYRIEPIPDGFLVYMSRGILKGTFTQAAYVFKYDKLTEVVKVFSPNAACYVPGIGGISLDNAGFHITKENSYPDGGLPQPWEIEKGDYIKKNILSYLNENLYGTVCLYYSQAEQKLFVTFSDNTREGVMQTGFVYTIVNKRWGSFDHNNTGIFETFAAVNNTYTCAYMGIDGFMHAFSNTDFSQDIPAAPLTLQDYVYRPLTVTAEEPVRGVINAAGIQFQLGTTDINGSDNIPTAYKNYADSGVFYINHEAYSDTVDNWGSDPAMVIGAVILGGTNISMTNQGGVELYAIPLSLPKIGIASLLQIGPFRFTDQAQADETSALSTLILGLTTTSSFTVTEDYMLESGAQDWNVMNGAQDWGSGNSVPNVFELTLRDTDDGVNPPIQGDEGLQVYNNLGASNKYVPLGYSSIYHLLTLTAGNPGESFALKFADFTGLSTGRLQQS